MKTKLFIVMAIAIIALAIIGCKQDTPLADTPLADTPRVQPDTPRNLSFGTPARTVTIKSDDQFTAAEWKTLCDKVVAAIERGYNALPNEGAKNSVSSYFANHTVSVVLLKSATYDVELKNSAPNIMYFKANTSTIDGLSGGNLNTILTHLLGGEAFHTP